MREISSEIINSGIPDILSLFLKKGVFSHAYVDNSAISDRFMLRINDKKEALELRLRQIEKRFQKTKDKNPKKAAEIAYVIAMNAKKSGDNLKAIKFGKECIRLLNITNPRTMEECASIFTVINSVVLPEFFYQDVVRSRLSPLVL